MRAVSPNLVSSWEVPVLTRESKGNLLYCLSCFQPPPAAVAAPDLQGGPRCQAGISAMGPALCQSIASALLRGISQLGLGVSAQVPVTAPENWHPTLASKTA